MKLPSNYAISEVRQCARAALVGLMLAALSLEVNAQPAATRAAHTTAAAPSGAASGAAGIAAATPAGAASAPGTATAATAETAAPTTPAAAPGGKPDLARAQQIAGQVCASCHGAEGISAAPVNPNLAAQHAQYLSVQLDHFKSGLRKNAVMNAMAAQLTPDEMRALGVYFAEKKPKAGTARDKTLAELGQKIYRGGNTKTGLPACSSCHLPNGVGIPVQYPRLAGQYPDYVYAQLQGFVKGDRGGEMKSAQGKVLEDVQGKVMTNIAGKMSDREMRAVAEYVSGLR